MPVSAAFISINLHLPTTRTYLFAAARAERAAVEDAGVWAKVPRTHGERTVLDRLAIHRDFDLHDARRVGNEADRVRPVALVGDLHWECFEGDLTIRHDHVDVRRSMAHRTVLDVPRLQHKFRFLLYPQVHQPAQGFQRAVPGNRDLRCDDAEQRDVVLRLIRRCFHLRQELQRVGDFHVHRFVRRPAAVELPQQQTHEHQILLLGSFLQQSFGERDGGFGLVGPSLEVQLLAPDHVHLRLPTPFDLMQQRPLVDLERLEVPNKKCLDVVLDGVALVVDFLGDVVELRDGMNRVSRKWFRVVLRFLQRFYINFRRLRHRSHFVSAMDENRALVAN